MAFAVGSKIGWIYELFEENLERYASQTTFVYKSTTLLAFKIRLRICFFCNELFNFVDYGSCKSLFFSLDKDSLVTT